MVIKRLKQREEKSEVYYFGEGNFIGKLLKNVFPVGELKTVTIPIPTTSLENVLEGIFNQKPDFVPQNANAYVVTGFNPDTYSERDGKMHSTHALQFYRIGEK